MKILQINFALLCLFICLPAEAYKNPVQGVRDSPDPGVVYDEQFYYAATTGGWDTHWFPIWQSKNLFNWTQVGWGFAERPPWTKCCDYWAPEIHLIGRGYHLFYTARDQAGFLCIGVATSDRPGGPYIDKGQPLMRNSTQGVIDATVFKDNDGTLYLVYKVDGNAHGHPTQIYAIKLSSDGKSVSGQHTLLIKNTLSWEAGIVEAPWIVYHNNYFYLFYSACGYHDKCYSLGVARATKFLGPYEKKASPILHTRSSETSESWEGPGHCSVVKTLMNNFAVVYHAWPHGQIGTKRLMLVDQLIWQNGWPKISNDSPSEEAMPNF